MKSLIFKAVLMAAIMMVPGVFVFSHEAAARGGGGGGQDGVWISSWTNHIEFPSAPTYSYWYTLAYAHGTHSPMKFMLAGIVWQDPLHPTHDNWLVPIIPTSGYHSPFGHTPTTWQPAYNGGSTSYVSGDFMCNEANDYYHSTYGWTIQTMIPNRFIYLVLDSPIGLTVWTLPNMQQVFTGVGVTIWYC